MGQLNYQAIFIPPTFPFNSGKDPNVSFEVQSAVSKVKNLIQEFLQNELPAEMFFNQHIAELFEFRMAAFRWLVENQIAIEDFSVLVGDALSGLRHKPAYHAFCENIEFAVRTNIRAVSKLIPGGDKDKRGLDFSTIDAPPFVSYHDYLIVLGQSIPDEILIHILEWTNSSLAIEFAIAVAAIISDENPKIDAARVEDLAAFVANAGQEFGAITKEIVSLAAPKIERPEVIPSPEEISEQKTLAELGLAEFAAELRNYD